MSHQSKDGTTRDSLAKPEMNSFVKSKTQQNNYVWSQNSSRFHTSKPFLLLTLKHILPLVCTFFPPQATLPNYYIITRSQEDALSATLIYSLCTRHFAKDLHNTKRRIHIKLVYSRSVSYEVFSWSMIIHFPLPNLTNETHINWKMLHTVAVYKNNISRIFSLKPDHFLCVIVQMRHEYILQIYPEYHLTIIFFGTWPLHLPKFTKETDRTRIYTFTRITSS